MTDDDKTPPSGVRSLRPRRALDDAPDVIDPDLGVPERDLNLFDAYHYTLGVMAGEDPRPNTPEEQAIEDESWADAMEMMSKSPEQVAAEQAERAARCRRERRYRTLAVEASSNVWYAGEESDPALSLVVHDWRCNHL